MSYCRPMLLLALMAYSATLPAQAPVGQLSATDASVKGAVTMAAGGARVLSGSSVTAGAETAALRLSRGGEVRVCPRTALTVAASPTGRELMLSMSTGALEAHYPLAGSKDTLVTPDFRILLIGPGEFHLAIGADARGNTCVRTLEHNTSAVVVEEQMGDGVYQLGAHDQALFHNGSVANPESVVPPDCGCPPPPQNLVAEVQPVTPPPPAIPVLVNPLASNAPAPTAPPSSTPLPATTEMTAPPPATKNDVHIQVDAPFVFRGDQPAPVADMPIVARVRAQSLPPLLFEVPVLGPAPAAPTAPEIKVATARPEKKKGFFGHLRSAFAAIFR